jgi:hypothetical protein
LVAPLVGAEAGVLPFALADALRAGVSFLFAEALLAFGVRGPFSVLLADALRGGLFVVDGFLFAFGVVGASPSSGSGGFAMAVCVSLYLFEGQREFDVNVINIISIWIRDLRQTVSTITHQHIRTGPRQSRPLLPPSQTQLRSHVAHSSPSLYLNLHRMFEPDSVWGSNSRNTTANSNNQMNVRMST